VFAAQALRPYGSAFSARFQLVLQYRAAALAGFVTQCWFGGVKVMVYAAFYAGSANAAASAPLTLSQTITYTWLAQGLLALLPWNPDPEVVEAVRSGGVGYDRLRPVDAYGLWYARGLAWMIARAIPRLALMIGFAAVLLPLIGLSDWAWKPPPNATQAAVAAVSTLFALALSAAMIMLVNTLVVATMNGRGIQILIAPIVVLFSGNLLPLALFPDWARPALFVQPLAGLFDIPCRIYFGDLTGGMAWAGIGLQAFWCVIISWSGRTWLERVMTRLQVQGG
jgi:ABC-2 type transport system permease protein